MARPRLAGRLSALPPLTCASPAAAKPLGSRDNKRVFPESRDRVALQRRGFRSGRDEFDLIAGGRWAFSLGGFALRIRGGARL